MLSTDQVTAIVPDAASLKAGRGLATARKWELLGGDEEALWGLAVGSGKNPYQTRVALSDLATKCSCPSRKFPCKHAIALMLIAAGDAAALSEKTRPNWLTEWLDLRAARQEKSKEKAAKKSATPVDGKAAAKRREKKAARVEEGVGLLRQTLLDLTREGLASPTARDASMWETLERRMVDCQAPGLAGAMRFVSDSVLRHPDVEHELAFEMGRLFLLCESHARRDELEEDLRAEVEGLVGDGPRSEEVLARPPVVDDWIVAGRRIYERDRLVTSVSWLFGKSSQRWAKVLRFAHSPSTITEPWPLGSRVNAGLSFYPGPQPGRALAQSDGHAVRERITETSDGGFEEMQQRFAEALAANPFLRTLPFLIELRPDAEKHLTDEKGRALRWEAGEMERLRVEAISGGKRVLACGEWDGQRLTLLSIADGENWVGLERGHS